MSDTSGSEEREVLLYGGVRSATDCDGDKDMEQLMTFFHEFRRKNAQ